MVVRPGRVRPAGNDRVERERLGTELAQRPLEPPRHLRLRPPDESLPPEQLERLGEQRCGAPERVELAVVLDRPQPLDGTLRRDELDATGGERAMGGEADLVGLERDRPGRELPKRLPQEDGQLPVGLHELDTGDGARRVHVAPVGDQPGVLGVDQHGRVRALEAGQVADVDGGCDEKRRSTELGQPRTQPLDPLAHWLPASHASASR